MRPSKIRGTFLLEALVALVVFSLGMLGLSGIVAHALQQSGSAQWRSEASDVAAGVLSQIWTEDAAALASRYDAVAPGPGYRALLAQATHLPGVSALANAPQVTVDDTAETRRVSVTVHWQLPAERIAHRASIAGVLPRP
jgi:type IV pilus assembly protein PilV